MKREFTGRHMLIVMLGMFGTIIAVNFIMARYAVSTFGGTVVDNSYVASQRFNGWLAEARAQEALGWSLDLQLSASRRVEVTASPHNGVVTALAHHPLGRAPDRQLRFEKIAAGHWRSTEPLPPGRWQLRVELRSGANQARYLRDVAA